MGTFQEKYFGLHLYTDGEEWVSAASLEDLERLLYSIWDFDPEAWENWRQISDDLDMVFSFEDEEDAFAIRLQTEYGGTNLHGLDGKLYVTAKAKAWADCFGRGAVASSHY